MTWLSSYPYPPLVITTNQQNLEKFDLIPQCLLFFIFWYRTRGKGFWEEVEEGNNREEWLDRKAGSNLHAELENKTLGYPNPQKNGYTSPPPSRVNIEPKCLASFRGENRAQAILTESIFAGWSFSLHASLSHVQMSGWNTKYLALNI